MEVAWDGGGHPRGPQVHPTEQHSWPPQGAAPGKVLGLGPPPGEWRGQAARQSPLPSLRPRPGPVPSVSACAQPVASLLRRGLRTEPGPELSSPPPAPSMSWSLGSRRAAGSRAARPPRRGEGVAARRGERPRWVRSLVHRREVSSLKKAQPWTLGIRLEKQPLASCLNLRGWEPWERVTALFRGMRSAPGNACHSSG